MKSRDKCPPRLEHEFSFGLWTVCNPGRAPFDAAVRLLGEGA